MDSLSIFIIVISVVLAIAFKWYLFRRIQRWIDRDLIKGLASSNPALEQRLLEADQDFRAAGMKRAERHQKLEQLASNGEPGL
ncbi:hypothetical protein [Marinobacterium mangrovicola]|uniref:Uncharacterized protein n=1 Tax=Marinobacterium mangrovicola TaxID=1476959 RepID=A0A4R1GNN6_9GAMM|nr:hypothetical protein [Marinobacterium mangrovicola]TCK08860.1 hypothetical protein CLV83_0956 [Marinobacterium mangrovicola]